MGTALEKEMETFEAKKKELLARAEGMFVLVKGEIIIGVFESQGDALREGYKLFGKEAFLVKQILAVEPPLPFASPLIGV